MDTFRNEYKELTEDQKIEVHNIKDHASMLLRFIEDHNDPNRVREFALAITKLEECIMWAVKGITK